MAKTHSVLALWSLLWCSALPSDLMQGLCSSVPFRACPWCATEEESVLADGIVAPPDLSMEGACCVAIYIKQTYSNRMMDLVGLVGPTLKQPPGVFAA